jgi:hypothetical protein
LGFDFVIQWVTVGAVDVNIGANPSAEEGGEDEGVDDSTQRLLTLSTPSDFRSNQLMTRRDSSLTLRNTLSF